MNRSAIILCCLILAASFAQDEANKGKIELMPPSNLSGALQAKKPSEDSGVKIEAGGKIFDITLTENDAARAFAEMMKLGPVYIKMNDYSGFEKVGSLGKNLPQSNSQMTTSAGDIILYNGNQIVVFYGSNSWSYTRLGKIDDISGLEEALGEGDITITFFVK